MCGIAGYIGAKQLEQSVIDRTLRLMKNRGPDNQQHRRVRQGAVNVDLLHARLSIIDLDERANQPLTIGSATLIFNGEIYNYVELRRQLAALGVSFKTDSDTEVLLQAYRKWGQACVDKLEGMWALAIWDESKRQLWLSRDRFAEKPLYYLVDKSGFYFASETKLLKTLVGRPLVVNQQQLLRYLVNGYKSLYKTEETFFKDVKEVPYATNLTIDEDLNVKQRRYWTPQYKPERITLTEAIDRTREALLESVRLRLRADVPLAFCLSGGVDSGALVSIAAKEFDYNVTTFSIVDPDERYNEKDNIMAVVEDVGCRHELIELEPGYQNLERLQKLVAYHDAPVATSAYLVHAYLSEAMGARGYKVAVSGTGADELFSGYFDHWIWQLIDLQGQVLFNERLREWDRFVSPLVRNPLLRDARAYLDKPDNRAGVYSREEGWSDYIRVDFGEDFFEEKMSNSVLRNRMMNEMFHEGVRLILHEDDLNSMRYSIENRSPYLDRGLFEAAYSIPVEHLMKGGYNKYPLRMAVDGILTDEVRLSREKKGFNAAISSLVDFQDSRSQDYLLSASPIFDLINRDKIADLMARPVLSHEQNKLLFSFISTKMFLDLVQEPSLAAM